MVTECVRASSAAIRKSLGYGRDEAFQKHYATSAKDETSWKAFVDEFLSGSEEDYQKAVTAFAEKVAAEKAAQKGAK